MNILLDTHTVLWFFMVIMTSDSNALKYDVNHIEHERLKFE